MSSELTSQPNSLLVLLKQADPEDLDLLIDYITDKGDGRITLNGDVCKRLLACQKAARYSGDDLHAIAREIQRFGGNTIANFMRDARNSLGFAFLDGLLPSVAAEVEYREIVHDVASHLKVAVARDDDVPAMEDGILRSMLSASYEKMSVEEKKALLDALNIRDMGLLQPAALTAAIAAGQLGGFATYRLAAIVANAVARALLGRGLSVIAGVGTVRGLGVLIGPIGWILAGIWTLADMASPAYRVTVPCVVQLAYMRQKALHRAFTKECGACGAISRHDARFCAECGKPLDDKAA